MSLLTQALAKQLVLVAYVIPRYESLLCFFARLTAWWRWAACRRVTSDTHVRDEVNSRLRCSLFAASGACSASSFFVVAHRLWRVTASAQLIVSSVWRDDICFWRDFLSCRSSNKLQVAFSWSDVKVVRHHNVFTVFCLEPSLRAI